MTGMEGTVAMTGTGEALAMTTDEEVTTVTPGEILAPGPTVGDPTGTPQIAETLEVAGTSPATAPAQIGAGAAGTRSATRTLGPKTRTRSKSPGFKAAGLDKRSAKRSLLRCKIKNNLWVKAHKG